MHKMLNKKDTQKLKEEEEEEKKKKRKKENFLRKDMNDV